MALTDLRLGSGAGADLEVVVVVVRVGVLQEARRGEGHAARRREHRADCRRLEDHLLGRFCAGKNVGERRRGQSRRLALWGGRVAAGRLAAGQAYAATRYGRARAPVASSCPTAVLPLASTVSVGGRGRTAWSQTVGWAALALALALAPALALAVQGGLGSNTHRTRARLPVFPSLHAASPPRWRPVTCTRRADLRAIRS
eukprot:COSAG04_NODE_338_length_16370_cov_18.584230_10_plen_200_part_00